MLKRTKTKLNNHDQKIFCVLLKTFLFYALVCAGYRLRYFCRIMYLRVFSLKDVVSM